MDDQRRKVIVSEIQNWRKNHLLPEHYCIFLLNLYTEGESPAPEEKPSQALSSRPSKPKRGFFERAFRPEPQAQTIPDAGPGRGGPARSNGGAYSSRAEEVDAADYVAASGGSGNGSGKTISNYAPAGNAYTIPTHQAMTNPITGKMILGWLIGASVIAALILLAFHFNGFSTLMQITIFTSIVFFFYIMAFFFKRRAPVLSHVSLAVVSLLLVAGGFFFMDKLLLPDTALLVYLGILCLFWCVNGLMFGYGYLLYCGIIGLGMLYATLMIKRIEFDYTWWRAELYWVPLAALMVGLGFLLNRRNTQLAGVFAFCGVAYFFGAELASLYIEQAPSDIIQLLLFIKVFMVSILFFFTRGYWFHWLRL
ncbi:hypothetical protein [Brevibacillus dissolubilis]|uniref:hypothetical protein n=1 Tax=Brevibacillus dissolubilis TaxID=1844116 RepID=UPI001115E43C|nr:hypothetical protein [Brevibacillus dissolubilis]